MEQPSTFSGASQFTLLPDISNAYNAGPSGLGDDDILSEDGIQYEIGDEPLWRFDDGRFVSI